MNYRALTDLNEIKCYLEGADILAFDFETAPDAPFRGDDRAALDAHRAHIAGISFSKSEGDAIYVPLSHAAGVNARGQDELWRYLKSVVFESARVVKIAHNFAFEAMFLYARGIVVLDPCYDTIAAAQLTLKSKWEFRDLRESGLKSLAASLFGVELPDFKTVTGGRHFDELDAQDTRTIRYACADADFTLRLYHRFNAWFESYLPAHRVIAEKVESPTAVYCGLMKYNGIPADRALMQKKQAEAAERLAALKSEIDGMTGGVDIGANASTAAFRRYLYGELGLPVLKTTEKNKEAADDEAIILLREWCAANRPGLTRLFDCVQEYRRWGKLKSTYIDGYLEHINPATGRIHPELMPLGTETGRFASRSPNLQNCPRKDNDPVGVRSFIAAPEGSAILSLDLSQIELRVGAFYCRDERMMETYMGSPQSQTTLWGEEERRSEQAFAACGETSERSPRRRGGDIHAQTTAVIYNIPFEAAADKNAEGYKERRTIAKNCNFGVFYGLFPRGLQRTLKFKAGLDTTLSACGDIIANLKSGYPGLARWQDEVKARTAETCFAETWLGRRRYLIGMRSDDWARRAFAERCALNTPIQGTAADILKLACARILSGLPERPWLKPLLQIHDELVFEVPADRVGEAADFVRTCMESRPFPEFDLPIIAEAAFGPSFGNLIEME